MEKHIFPILVKKYVFLDFGGIIRFSNFDKKLCFRALTENAFFQFWWKKNRLSIFSEKMKISNFGEKMIFQIMIGNTHTSSFFQILVKEIFLEFGGKHIF